MMVYLVHSGLSDEELDKRKYVFPEERKFPLPDKAHVLSAIKFFNYVEPSKEKILARAILKRMKEYGITEVNVGAKNRFSKYYHPKEEKKMGNYYLAHSAKGQTWKNHKYIGIKNGRYIYPENVKRKIQDMHSDRVPYSLFSTKPDTHYKRIREVESGNIVYGDNKSYGSRIYRKADVHKQREEAAAAKIEKMHSHKLNGSNLTYNRSMESGNVVDGKVGYGNKIYRQSDVNQKAIMAYSKINGFKKAVQKFGEKGKAFLLALFKKK